MIAYFMPLFGQTFDDFGVAINVFTDEKEGSFYAVTGKYINNAFRVDGMGTIVKGQGYIFILIVMGFYRLTVPGANGDGE